MSVPTAGAGAATGGGAPFGPGALGHRLKRQLRTVSDSLYNLVRAGTAGHGSGGCSGTIPFSI